MKKLFAIAMVLVLAPAASATPIVYDGFNYTAGNFLRNSGGWVNTGSIGATPRPTIASGSLSYPGLPTSTGNNVALTNANGTADRLPTGTIASGTVYYSFIVQLSAVNDTAAGISGTGGAFFAGFDDHTTGSTFTTAAALYVRRDSGDAGKFNLGIATAGAANKSFSGALSPSDTLFVVGSFTFNGASTLDIFVNPDAVPGSAPVTHTLTTTGPDTTTASILSFFLRQNTGEPSTINVDELRIGTTWADVAPVPEPASLGFFAMGSVAVLARRSRARCVDKQTS